MKTTTHPTYNEVNYTCGQCGTVISTRSTSVPTAKLDVCSACHPAYTGSGYMGVKSSDRMAQFKNRFG